MKGNIEKEIRKHVLFQLLKDKAITRVFEKLGTIKYLFYKGDSNKVQAYLKQLCKTDQSNIDYINFIQQSIMWIVRWCCLYCSTSEIDVDVKVDDVLALMGIAYSYDQFEGLWNLHIKKSDMLYRK